jgi:hypothetical protein
LQDARKSEDIHNFTCTDWVVDAEGGGGDGAVTRTTTYEVTKSFGLTTANIKVAQKHVGGKCICFVYVFLKNYGKFWPKICVLKTVILWPVVNIQWWACYFIYTTLLVNSTVVGMLFYLNNTFWLTVQWWARYF